MDPLFLWHQYVPTLDELMDLNYAQNGEPVSCMYPMGHQYVSWSANSTDLYFWYLFMLCQKTHAKDKAGQSATSMLYVPNGALEPNQFSLLQFLCCAFAWYYNYFIMSWWTQLNLIRLGGPPLPQIKMGTQPCSLLQFPCCAFAR